MVKTNEVSLATTYSHIHIEVRCRYEYKLCLDHYNPNFAMRPCPHYLASCRGFCMKMLHLNNHVSKLIKSICQAKQNLTTISDNVTICVHRTSEIVSIMMYKYTLVHPMKFITTRWSTMLAKMKSANALSGLIVNWLWFLGLLWIRKQTAWREGGRT